MIDTLKHLYGDSAHSLNDKINKLLKKYEPKIKEDIVEKTLSEKDIILISYGDNVQQKGHSHLQTLNKFVKEYCLPEINCLHVLPFYCSSSDDGFSVIDYFEVDPNLGSWDDISKLSKNINLMFDAVVNHMSKSSQPFQKFLNQEDGFQDFFIDVEPNTDLSKVVRPRATPLLTTFHDKNRNEKYIWSTFSDDQLDLNFSSHYVFIYVLEVLLFYISKGAKLIRLDAIGFIWKKTGTSCIHLPEAHEIIKLYRKIIESITKDIIFITETNVPHIENISYFGNGFDEAQMVYNFTLPPLLVYSIMEENVEKLNSWAKSLKLPSNKVCFFNFTASHDGIGLRPLQNIVSDADILKLANRAKSNGGLVSYKINEDGTKSPYELNCNYMDLLSGSNEDDEIRLSKMMLTQALCLAIPGVPGIYFHSLIGSRNYIKGVKETGINRRINREKINFYDLEKEISDSNSLRRKVYVFYKRMIAIRTNQKAFNPFSAAKYSTKNSNKVFIIQREYNDEIIYTLYNFGRNSIEVDALSTNVFDLINEKEMNSSTWTLQPFSFLWLKQTIN